MRTRWLAAAALVALLVGNPAPAAADAAAGSWSQQGQDAGRSFYQARPGGLILASAGRLEQHWSRSDPAFTNANIAYYGGSLYAVFANRTIRKLDPATGATRATVLRAPWTVEQIVVTGDGIYLRSSAAIAAYDLNGRQRWIFKPGPQEPHINPFVHADGRLVVVTGPDGCDEYCRAPDRVRVLRADTGVAVWTRLTGGHADLAPMVVDGILHQEVHANNEGPRTTAYRLATGTVLWDRPPGSVQIAGGGGQLYDGDLCAWSSTTGRKRWCLRRRASQLALAPGAVFAYLDETRVLVRLTNDDGTVSWRLPLGEGTTLMGNLIVGGGVVHAVLQHRDSDDQLRSSELVALNAATGAVLRRISLGPSSAYPQMLAGGRLYLAAWASNRNLLLAFGPDKRKPRSPGLPARRDA